MGCGRGAARGTVVAASLVTGGLAHAFAATEHLHLVGDDVGRVFLNAIFVGVLAGFQAAFHIDGAALFEVLAGDFSQFAKEGDTVPLGLFYQLSSLAFVFAAGGNGDVGDRLTAGQITNFRIAPQVADQNDFVNGCHEYSLCLNC